MATQRLIKLLWIVPFFIPFSNSLPARADSLQINVPEVKVYAQPNTNSEVVTTLFKGDAVPVSRNPIPNFKKVLIKDGNQKKIGYIANADLQKAAPMRPGQQKMARRGPVRRVVRSRNMRGRSSAGIIFGLNYQYQNSRSYTDSNGGNANIGTLSGSNFEFGGFFNIPINYSFLLHTYVEMKNIVVTGQASYQTSTIPATPTDTYLSESFLVFGALAQFYPSTRSNWWWGPGLQFEHASSGTLKFGTYSPTSLTGSDLPNFIMLYGAIGLDFKLFGDIYFIPDLRIGGIVNALPMILEADAVFKFSYAF